MIAIAILCCARSNKQKLLLFFACAMISPYFINVITIKSTWYIILICYSSPSKIRFASHMETSAILCNSMLLPFASQIQIVPIFSIRITYLTTVMKLMFFISRLQNSFWLLQSWWDVYKSKKQVLPALSFCNSFLTIKLVPTGPSAKSSGSEI